MNFNRHYGIQSTFGGSRKKPDFSRINWRSEIAKHEDLEIYMTTRCSHSGEVINTVEVDFRLSHLRKEEHDIEAGYLKALLQELTANLKSKKGYVRSSIELGTIDHYTSYTNIYDSPTISHTKGSRTYKEGYSEHGSIPKGWTVNSSVIFEGELTTRMKNSILQEVLSVVGLEYSKEVQKVIAKNAAKMKKDAGENGIPVGSYFSWQLD